MIVKKIGRKKPSKREYYYLCVCDDCKKEFERRCNYRSFERCIACANIVGGKIRKIHGCNTKNSRLYVTWHNMKKRCLDPNNKKYGIYGGAGITICDEWLDFPGFMEWAMSAGYNDDLTIDRIDPKAGYFPNNCRFVDVSTQNANRRNKIGVSGYIGVHRGSNGSYVSRVVWKGQVNHIGCFANGRMAAIARDEFIIDKNLPHRLNFPNEKGIQRGNQAHQGHRETITRLESYSAAIF